MNSFADDFRDFAFGLVRDQARLIQSGIADSPARVAPPEMESAPPAFGELSMSAQLDIAQTVCRRDPFLAALNEALVEHDKYHSFMRLLLDSCVPNAEVGRMAREMVLEYLQRVAVNHALDLGERA